MIKHGITLEGLADLETDLKRLSQVHNKRVIRQATRAGAGIIRDAAREHVPIKTGKLKRNIITSSVRQSTDAIVKVRGVNSRGTNSDSKMKASDPKNAFYGRFVELGTSTSPAHPFLRPAFDAVQDKVTSTILTKLAESIDKVFTK